TRRHLGRLVRTLLLTGAALAFLGIVDYMVGERWLLAWRQHPFGGRLSGTFTNPDHFAAWLAMLMALGLGWVVARSPGRRRSPQPRADRAAAGDRRRLRRLDRLRPAAGPPVADAGGIGRPVPPVRRVAADAGRVSGARRGPRSLRRSLPAPPAAHTPARAGL